MSIESAPFDILSAAPASAMTLTTRAGRNAAGASTCSASKAQCWSTGRRCSCRCGASSTAARSRRLTQVSISQMQPSPMASTVALRVQDIRRSLYYRLQGAERRIWLMTAYFVPSRRTLRALRQAAQRGVDVRLLLPGPVSDHPAIAHAGRRFYSPLLRAGVRVFEYQPRFMHAKAVICDDWVSIGSSNFDRWNLHWNLEANQEIDDQPFADQVCAVIDGDLRDCIEIRYPDWHQRGLAARLREQLWGRIDRLLEGLGRLRRDR
ncbi:MAG: hypothetical protein HY940_00850 [Gammaproteobacteria bacterium]|nr:hypothetical protein [Gammaproteobacteria bacterium]